MPTSDNKQKDTESLSDSTRDVDRDKDREKDKGSKAKGPSKKPGQQKEVCAWFVKGNCKFGHKCALAHILPGQSMSMDRKNKKAAQLAANSSSAGGSAGKDGARAGRMHKNSSQNGSGGGSQSRNALLSGSTAPTRAVSGNTGPPIPMPLKATLSPPAPAPPVKDTDFASFGLPDETNQLPSAPAHGKPTATSPGDLSTNAQDSIQDDQSEQPSDVEHTAPSPLPPSVPSAPRRVNDGTPVIDLGPIGSPPRSSPSATQPSRINGFSPGTSPQGQGISTSPFSAPGTQSVFILADKDDASNDFKTRSGISASLGAMMTWSSDRIQTRRMNGIVAEEVVVEDEDLEEFLPSSLTDLLTPEERSRRLSRTNGARPNVLASERYSRSVPAPSLLQDIRSIWADIGNPAVGSPDGGFAGSHPIGGGLGNGTPSSFQSNSGLAGRSGEDMLSPSNASAAFLPGLHHYLNSKAQRSNLGMTSLYPSATSGAAVSHTLSSSAYGPGLNGAALSPPRSGAFGTRSPFDHAPGDPYLSHSSQRPSGRPIPAGSSAFVQDLDDRRSALSPLPQGLAAGYSRIHALPPPVIASPSTSGAFSPGQLGHGHSTSGDWTGMSPNAGNLLEHLQTSQISPNTPVAPGTSAGNLGAMFSRLSYSAAASRANAAPSGLGPRNPSGRGYHAQGTLSPLSGPVVTGDDDDLFSME
ncbi:hypothetical protein A0H81_14892 [Grifola frondosa]|uniref:C3H1-type domain-containing protein n=1 Tax=Grifola frondosa TaxID=5627 RepID=A0A1C7LJY6_GRIFR|nr:hypothetical protein A0H81_14892 [Grifola frondosa]